MLIERRKFSFQAAIIKLYYIDRLWLNFYQKTHKESFGRYLAQRKDAVLNFHPLGDLGVHIRVESQQLRPFAILFDKDQSNSSFVFV